MPGLSEEQKQKLDTNIKGMLSQGATQDDVMRYASDFNEKFGNNVVTEKTTDIVQNNNISSTSGGSMVQNILQKATVPTKTEYGVENESPIERDLRIAKEAQKKVNDQMSAVEDKHYDIDARKRFTEFQKEQQNDLSPQEFEKAYQDWKVTDFKREQGMSADRKELNNPNVPELLSGAVNYFKSKKIIDTPAVEQELNPLLAVKAKINSDINSLEKTKDGFAKTQDIEKKAGKPIETLTYDEIVAQTNPKEQRYGLNNQLADFKETSSKAYGLLADKFNYLQKENEQDIADATLLQQQIASTDDPVVKEKMQSYYNSIVSKDGFKQWQELGKRLEVMPKEIEDKLKENIDLNKQDLYNKEQNKDKGLGDRIVDIPSKTLYDLLGGVAGLPEAITKSVGGEGTLFEKVVTKPMGEWGDNLINFSSQTLSATDKANTPQSYKVTDYKGQKLLVDPRGQAYSLRDENLKEVDDTNGLVAEWNNLPNDKKTKVEDKFNPVSALYGTAQVVSDMIPLFVGGAEADATGVLTKGQKVANYAKGLTTVVAQTNNQIYNQIKDNPNLTEAQKNQYSLGVATAIGILNLKLGPEERLLGLTDKEYSKTLGQTITDNVVRVANGKATGMDVAMQFVKQASKNAGHEIPEEILEEIFLEPILQNTVNHVVNKATGANIEDQKIDLESIKEQALPIILGTGIIGSLGSYKGKNQLQNEALWSAVNSFDKFKEVTASQIQSGSLSEDLGNKTVNTVEKIVNTLNDTPNLSEKDRYNLGNLMFHNDQLQTKLESNISDVYKSKLKDAIKSNDVLIDKLLSNEKLTPDEVNNNNLEDEKTQNTNIQEPTDAQTTTTVNEDVPNTDDVSVELLQKKIKVAEFKGQDTKDLELQLQDLKNKQDASTEKVSVESAAPIVQQDGQGEQKGGDNANVELQRVDESNAQPKETTPTRQEVINNAIEIAKQANGNSELQDKYKILANSTYQSFIADGKMTAIEAKTILESAGVAVPNDILTLAENESKVSENNNLNNQTDETVLNEKGQNGIQERGAQGNENVSESVQSTGNERGVQSATSTEPIVESQTDAVTSANLHNKLFELQKEYNSYPAGELNMGKKSQLMEQIRPLVDQLGYTQSNINNGELSIVDKSGEAISQKEVPEIVQSIPVSAPTISALPVPETAPQSSTKLLYSTPKEKLDSYNQLRKTAQQFFASGDSPSQIRSIIDTGDNAFITQNIDDVLNNVNKTEKDFATEEKERSFARAALDVDKEVNDLLENKTYNKTNNKYQNEQADKFITDNGIVEATRKLLNNELGNMTDDVVNVVAQKLIRQNNKIKNYAESARIFDGVMEKLTEAGRLIQTAALWNLMTPEGVILFQKRLIEKGREKFKKDVQYKLESIHDKVSRIIKDITESPEIKAQISRLVKTERIQGKARSTKAIEWLDSIKLKGIALSTIPGVNLLPATYNASIEIIKTGIKAGIGINKVLGGAIKYIKENLSDTENFDENSYRKYFNDKLPKVQKDGLSSAEKEMGATISQIVKEHFTIGEKYKEGLVKRLVEKAGLSEEEAERTRKIIEAQFDKKVVNSLEKDLANKKQDYQKPLQKIKEGKLASDDVKEILYNQIGLDNLNESDIKTIEDLHQKVIDAADGSSEQKDRLQDLMGHLEARVGGLSNYSIMKSLLYASILSGTKTQLKNVISNTMQTAVELYTNAVYEGLVKGDFKAVYSLVSNLLTGYKRGVLEAKKTITTGYDPNKTFLSLDNNPKVGKLDPLENKAINEKLLFKGGNLNPLNAAKFVKRFMIAADTLFYYGLKEMESGIIARRLAIEKGLTGEELQKEVNDILYRNDDSVRKFTEQARSEGLESPQSIKRRALELAEQSRDIDITYKADKNALKATYNNDPTGAMGIVSKMVSNFVQGTEKSNKMLGAIATTIAPFTRVIANVINEQLNLTPIGIVRGLRKKGHLFPDAENDYISSEERAKLLIKGITGTLLMTALIAMGLRDDNDDPTFEITANGFGNSQDNAKLYDRGWQPYTIKVGDYRYNYQNTTMGQLLGVVGTVLDNHKYNKDKNTSEKVGILTSAFINQILNASALQGTAQLFDALGASNSDNKNKLISMALDRPKMLIPNIFKEAQKIVDNKLYEKSDFKGILIYNVPVAQSYGKPKLNVWGDVIKLSKYNIITNPDKVQMSIDLAKKDIDPSMPSHATKINGQVMNDDQFYEFSKIRGKYLKEYVNETIDEIMAEPDNDRAKDLYEKQQDLATKQAKLDIADKYPETFK